MDGEAHDLRQERLGELADVPIVTSDNPRSEDPEAIIDEIAAAMGGGTITEVDRNNKENGDPIAIAGHYGFPFTAFTLGDVSTFTDREDANRRVEDRPALGAAHLGGGRRGADEGQRDGE